MRPLVGGVTTWLSFIDRRSQNYVNIPPLRPKILKYLSLTRCQKTGTLINCHYV